MKRAAAQCKICGKTLTPEEVEVGMPMVCPRCKPKEGKKGPSNDDSDKR